MDVWLLLFMHGVEVIEAVDEGAGSALLTAHGSNTIEKRLHFTAWLNHSLVTLSTLSQRRHSSPPWLP